MRFNLQRAAVARRRQREEEERLGMDDPATTMAEAPTFIVR
jgi:hypothetical protein